MTPSKFESALRITLRNAMSLSNMKIYLRCDSIFYQQSFSKWFGSSTKNPRYIVVDRTLLLTIKTAIGSGQGRIRAGYIGKAFFWFP